MVKNSIFEVLKGVLISLVCSIVSVLIFAFVLHGTEKIVSWIVFFVFVVYAFISYSCEKAVKLPDNFVNDKK